MTRFGFGYSHPWPIDSWQKRVFRCSEFEHLRSIVVLSKRSFETAGVEMKELRTTQMSHSPQSPVLLHAVHVPQSLDAEALSFLLTSSTRPPICQQNSLYTIDNFR